VFQKLSELLVANGRLILSFRDLSEERFGVNRFIPIRSDPERIMTCLLEFEQEPVIVHDLLYVRKDEGWELHKSAYRKQRRRDQGGRLRAGKVRTGSLSLVYAWANA
jgi:hypothetical protein